MDVKIAGALVAAGFIILYLAWKKWAAQKKSAASAEPAVKAEEPAVEPAVVREEEPLPAEADQAEADQVEADQAEADQPETDQVETDQVEAAIVEEMRPAGFEALVDEALSDDGPTETLEDDGPVPGGEAPEETAAEAIASMAAPDDSAEAGPAPVEQPAEAAVEQETEQETVAPHEQVTVSEADLPPVHCTLEAYTSRMNDLEEQKRALLAQAIADQDDALRDRLQRELVVMNDRLALVADSYAEDIVRMRQVVHVLARLRAEASERPALDAAIDSLCHGDTEPAEACLAVWSGQSQPLAADVAFSRGLLAECRADLYQALALYRQAATSLHSDNAQHLLAAGRMARLLYRYQEAIPWLESSVRLTRQSGGDDPLPLAFAQRELAYAYILAGQHQKAGPLYKEAMLTLAEKLGPDHQEMAVCWFQIGELQETLGEYDKAVGLYKKALAIMEREKGEEHPSLAPLLAKLAAICMELEMEPEAVPLYERLVRIQEKTLRADRLQLAVSLNGLAESYRLVGRYFDAESSYLKILEINEAAHGPDHPSVAAVLQELAKLNIKLRRPERANQYQDRAAAIFTKNVEAAEEKSGDAPLTLEL